MHPHTRLLLRIHFRSIGRNISSRILTVSDRVHLLLFCYTKNHEFCLRFENYYPNENIFRPVFFSLSRPLMHFENFILSFHRNILCDVEFEMLFGIYYAKPIVIFSSKLTICENVSKDLSLHIIHMMGSMFVSHQMPVSTYPYLYIYFHECNE